MSRETTKIWREKNKEYTKEYNKQYHKKHYLLNKDRLLEYGREWRSENKVLKAKLDKEYRERMKENPEWVEKYRARMRENYHKKAKLNPGFANELFKERYKNDEEFRNHKRKYAVAYAKKHKYEKYIWNNNYRVRRRNAEGSFNIKDWIEILKKNDYSCVLCGIKGMMTIDHIIPLSKEGTNYPENIQPLCRSCNCKKSNKILLNT